MCNVHIFVYIFIHKVIHIVIHKIVYMFTKDWQAVGKRLEELREALGIKSKRQFALALHADESYFSKAIQGAGLSETYIKILEDEFNVSRDWLLFGEGEKFKKGRLPKKNELEIATLHNIPKRDLAIQIRNLIESDIKQQSAIKVFVSILSRVVSVQTDKEYDQVFGEIQQAIESEQRKQFDELV